MVPFFHATTVVKLHQWILALLQNRTNDYKIAVVNGYYYIIADIAPQDDQYIRECSS